MHVAFDLTLPARSHSGTRVYATELLAALRGLGQHRVSAIRHDKRLAGASPAERLVNALDLTVWMHSALPRQLARSGVDVLHAPAFIAPAGSPCPIVVSVHDTTYLTMPADPAWGWYARAFTLLTVRQAAAIITFSESARRDIADHYRLRAERIVVTPHGVNPRFRPMDRARAREAVARSYGVSRPFLLFVGAQERRKNVPTLLQALARMRSIQSPTRGLVLVGRRGGASREIRRTVHKLGLGDLVSVLGEVPDQALPLLYNAAEVLVLPSLAEGFGLPVLEAMACGTPVIAANTSALPEVAGDAAVLVNPEDAGVLAESIATLLGDGALRESLRERGLHRAGKFTWQRAARETVAVYERVVRGEI